MNELLVATAEFVSGLNPWAIYSVMIVIAYLENVIPPIPGDVVIVYGGFLAAEGLIGFPILLAGTSVSATLGFMTYFYLGWRWGDEAAIASRHRFLSRFMDANHIDKALHYMSKYGEWVILANRFLAGTRSIISISAGMSRMNWWQTTLNAFVSSLLWNVLLLGAGWQLKENWSVFGSYLKTYGQVVLVIMILAVAFRWLYKYRQQRVIKNP